MKEKISYIIESKFGKMAIGLAVVTFAVWIALLSSSWSPIRMSIIRSEAKSWGDELISSNRDEVIYAALAIAVAWAVAATIWLIRKTRNKWLLLLIPVGLSVGYNLSHWPWATLVTIGLHALPLAIIVAFPASMAAIAAGIVLAYYATLLGIGLALLAIWIAVAAIISLFTSGSFQDMVGIPRGTYLNPFHVTFR